MKRSVFRNRALPYLLVLPQIAVTVVFFFWPAFESLRLSLFRTSPFGDKTSFVGLENFRKLLTTPEYYQSIANTLVFASGVTAIGLGAGLFVAALATQKVRGLAAYRTAVLWPYGIAPPIAGIIFLFIFHPSYGVLPYWLGFVTSYEFNWLLKGWVAMALVILATAWTHVGYNIAFVLSFPLCALAACALAFGCALLLVPQLPTFLWETLTWQTGSSMSHLDAWRLGMENALRYPFGAGLGVADQAAVRFGLYPLAGDNVYLTYAVELGFVGLGLHLATIVGAGITGWNGAKAGHGVASDYAVVVAAVAAGILLNGITAVPFNSILLTSVFFWLLGSLVTRADLKDRS